MDKLQKIFGYCSSLSVFGILYAIRISIEAAWIMAGINFLFFGCFIFYPKKIEVIE